MSDVPDLSETGELTIINDLLERQREKLIAETNDQLEQYIRQAVARVDWSEVEVLDIVHQVDMATHTGFDGDTTFSRGHGFQYHGYESKTLAPDVDTYYGIGDHNKRVYRLTQHVCRDVGIDPTTGEDVE